MKNYVTRYPHFLHGGDYNPDQWLSYPQVLADDPIFMQKAHCNAMSLGIFAWATLEPEEGVYCFDEMDKIVENLTSHGIRLVMATPSAARPRWLAEKYPEVRLVNKRGVRESFNTRHNFCPSSPIYREKVRAINREIAKRYGDRVILWHISNELAGHFPHTCYCERCRQGFRDWLKGKYNGDLAALNHAWWAGFWSHQVTDWAQIDPPMDNGEPDNIMTGLHLDWMNYTTHLFADFLQMEADALREFTPHVPVTANLMGLPMTLDYDQLAKSMDVVSWDSYPQWHAPNHDFVAVLTAFNHDYFRALKRKPFLLMESTPSNTNWQAISKLKRPGMHKLSSLQVIAHGGDSVQYFQWRKGRGGSEKFHGAVIDHDMKAEGRVFEDVREVGLTLERIDEVCGTSVKAEVAVVMDHRSAWALQNASGFQNADKGYFGTCVKHYTRFWEKGVNVDVIGANAPLDGYKLLVCPMLYSLDEQAIENIRAFVEAGGTVVGTYATGYANDTDLCYLGGFPGGALKEVFGLVANEIDTLYYEERNGVTMDGVSYPVQDYCELITPTTATVLGTYDRDFYAGKPAVLKNTYGKGTAVYVGARDDGELMKAVYAALLQTLEIPTYDLPELVTVHSRENYLFVENYNAEPHTVTVGGEYTDLETGERLQDTVSVDGYGIRILRKM